MHVSVILTDLEEWKQCWVVENILRAWWLLGVKKAGKDMDKEWQLKVQSQGRDRGSWGERDGQGCMDWSTLVSRISSGPWSFALNANLCLHRSVSSIWIITYSVPYSRPIFTPKEFPQRELLFLIFHAPVRGITALQVQPRNFLNLPQGCSL